MLIMDLIKKILEHKTIREPDDFKIIKEFVSNQIGYEPRLEAQKKHIIIYIPNAADAGELRYHLHTLQKKIELKLMIKIG